MKKIYLLLLFLATQYVSARTSLDLKIAPHCIKLSAKQSFTSANTKLVNIPPAAPTAPSPQNFCEGFFINELIATGDNLKWYTEATGGTAIDETLGEYFFESKTYYVSQTVAGEESTRTAVVVNIGTAQPVVTSPQNFCNGATIADIVVTGTNIKWYDNVEGFELLTTTVLITQTYYVTQTINGCESPKLAVGVIVTAPPAAPNATSPQAFFNSATVANLTTTSGINIQWYNTLTGGSPLSNATTLVNGNTYYASQTTGCESPRKAVLVNITIFKIFYFKPAQSDLTVLANWGINADGSGTIPTTFLGNDFKFILTNSQTLPTTLTLGANTTFQLGEVGLPAVTLTITASGSIVSGTVNVTGATLGNNTLTIAGATSPNIGTLAMGTNGSTVVYNGTATQAMANAEYNNLTIDNATGVTANYNLTVNGTYWLKTGKFRISTNTLTLNGSVITDSNNAIVGSSSSYLVFGVYNGVSANCTFFMDNTTPNITNLLENLTVNRTGRVVTMGASVVTNYCTLTNGILAIGNNTFTLQHDIICSVINCLQTNGLSDIVIKGSGAVVTLYFDQSIPGKSTGTGNTDFVALTPGTTNNVRNFTLNRGTTATPSGGPGSPIITMGRVILGNQMQINNNLIPTQGILESNGNLIMLSTQNTTSSILTLGTDVEIIGNVVVQSFFKGGLNKVNRGMRMISFPIIDVAGTDNVFKQMQKRFIITGGPTAGVGMDAGGVKVPYATTIMTYNEPVAFSSANNYPVLNNINDLATKGKGYFFFYRGNRDNYYNKVNSDVNKNYADPDDWTGTYIGTINTGDVTINATHTVDAVNTSFDGYNLIGNPYPSTLDFSKFILDNTSLANQLIITRPNRSGFASTSNGVNNNYTKVNGTATTSLTDIRLIAPGQGFLVKKSAPGTSSIIFKENHKALATEAPTAVRLLNLKNNQLNSKSNFNINHLNKQLTPLNLIRINVEDEVNTDQATIVLAPGNDVKYDSKDVKYFGGSTVSCSSLTADTVGTAINFMPDIDSVDSIKLVVNATETNPNLKINFTDLTGAGDKDVTLNDAYTNKRIKINNTNNVYHFGINKADKRSFDRNRFTILFSNKLSLPIIIDDFKVVVKNNGFLLSWNTLKEENASKIIVESSNNQKVFKTINTQAINGNSNKLLTYSFLDTEPLNGIRYYRLKKVDINGSITYSDIVSVKFGLNINDELMIFPNPVKNEINVCWNTNQPVDIEIFDLNGKLLKSFQNVKTPNLKTEFSEAGTGTYILKLINHKNKNSIGISKFIKN